MCGTKVSLEDEKGKTSKHSLAVAANCVFLIIEGIVILSGLLLGMAMSPSGTNYMVAALLAVLYSSFCFIAAGGIILFKKWAWILTIIMNSMSAIVLLYAIVRSSGLRLFRGELDILYFAPFLFNLYFIYLLMRPKTKKQFMES